VVVELDDEPVAGGDEVGSLGALLAGVGLVVGASGVGCGEVVGGEGEGDDEAVSVAGPESERHGMGFSLRCLSRSWRASLMPRVLMSAWFGRRGSPWNGGGVGVVMAIWRMRVRA